MRGLICAMDKELALVRASFDEGRVRACLSGIGKVNAALAAASLLDSGVDCIVNIGVAGMIPCSDEGLLRQRNDSEGSCALASGALPGSGEGLLRQRNDFEGSSALAVTASPGSGEGRFRQRNAFSGSSALAGRGLRLGDVVLCAETAYHDVWCGEGNLPGQVQGLPARFAAEPALLERAARVLPDAVAGLCITGDRFISDSAEMQALCHEFPDALCVDMEAAAIAQTCFLRGVPFLGIKILSDGGSGAEYDEFWATLSERAFEVVKPLLETL